MNHSQLRHLSRNIVFVLFTLPLGVVHAQDSVPAESAGSGLAEWLRAGKLNLMLRGFGEYQGFDDDGSRRGVVLSTIAAYESPFVGDQVGVGFDVAPFAAVKLDGGKGSGNMVHVNALGGEQNKSSWAYFGNYMLKLRVGGSLFRYGVHSVSTPFMSSYDNRSLPPAFRGLSWEAPLPNQLTLRAGSFDAVIARGDTQLKPLTSGYGGTRIGRLSYLGAEWHYSPRGTATAYVGQANDVWSQSYASVAHHIGDPGTARFTSRTEFYDMRGHGRRLQGDISGHAISQAMGVQHRGSSLTLGVQLIRSDHFLDFVQETAGLSLATARLADYNAPHERSAQLRYRFNGNGWGADGVTVVSWVTASKGTNGEAQAAANPVPNTPGHVLYWFQGRPIRGSNREAGLFLSYVIQEGQLKACEISSHVVKYRRASFYPGRGFDDVGLSMRFPLRIF